MCECVRVRALGGRVIQEMRGEQIKTHCRK